MTGPLDGAGPRDRRRPVNSTSSWAGDNTGQRTADRDALLAAVDLEDLWCELVGHRGRGGGWPCPSPQHAQSGQSPPVSIDPTKGLWNCHGCDEGGTAIDMLVLLGADVADAFAELRRRAGQERPSQPPERPQKAPRPEPAPLGGTAAEAALTAHLDARSWRRELAEQFGLHAIRDQWGRVRVRYPYRIAGDTDWHQDRALGNVSPKWLAPPAVTPTLYAADLATALADAYRTGAVLVLEGPPDLIALAHAFGPSGLIAVPGTRSSHGVVVLGARRAQRRAHRR